MNWYSCQLPAPKAPQSDFNFQWSLSPSDPSSPSSGSTRRLPRSTPKTTFQLASPDPELIGPKRPLNYFEKAYAKPNLELLSQDLIAPDFGENSIALWVKKRSSLKDANPQIIAKELQEYRKHRRKDPHNSSLTGFWSIPSETESMIRIITATDAEEALSELEILLLILGETSKVNSESPMQSFPFFALDLFTECLLHVQNLQGSALPTQFIRDAIQLIQATHTSIFYLTDFISYANALTKLGAVTSFIYTPLRIGFETLINKCFEKGEPHEILIYLREMNFSHLTAEASGSIATTLIQHGIFSKTGAIPNEAFDVLLDEILSIPDPNLVAYRLGRVTGNTSLTSYDLYKLEQVLVKLRAKPTTTKNETALIDHNFGLALAKIVGHQNYCKESDPSFTISLARAQTVFILLSLTWSDKYTFSQALEILLSNESIHHPSNPIFTNFLDELESIARTFDPVKGLDSPAIVQKIYEDYVPRLIKHVWLPFFAKHPGRVELTLNLPGQNQSRFLALWDFFRRQLVN